MKITLRFIGIAATCPPLFNCFVRTFYLDVAAAAMHWLSGLNDESLRAHIDRAVVRWARHPGKASCVFVQA